MSAQQKAATVVRNHMTRLSKSILFLLSFLSIIGCARPIKPNTQTFFKNIPQVDICDLGNHEGELVLIKGVYSGVEEYWSLNSLEKCQTNLNIELDYYNDGRPIPRKYHNLFDSVHSLYWNTYLVIQATGRYESKSSDGYGHLGHNKSRFIIDKFIDIILVKKQENR